MREQELEQLARRLAAPPICRNRRIPQPDLKATQRLHPQLITGMEFYARQLQALQQLGDIAALPSSFGGKQQQRRTLEVQLKHSRKLEAIGTLYSEQHDFKTLVVDSLDWLEPLVWKHTC